MKGSRDTGPGQRRGFQISSTTCTGSQQGAEETSGKSWIGIYPIDGSPLYCVGRSINYPCLESTRASESLCHRSFHRTQITQCVGFFPVAQALGAPVFIPYVNPVFPGVSYKYIFLSLAGLNPMHIRLSSIAYGAISLTKTGNNSQGSVDISRSRHVHVHIPRKNPNTHQVFFCLVLRA